MLLGSISIALTRPVSTFSDTPNPPPVLRDPPIERLRASGLLRLVGGAVPATDGWECAAIRPLHAPLLFP